MFYAAKLNAARWLWVLALILPALTGCQWMQKNLQRPQAQLPVAYASLPSLDQIVSDINANTRRVQQLESRVQLSIDGVPARLSGNFALQRPRNLRVEAGVLGMNQWGIDFGSNEELFWLWSKSAVGSMQPVILFARHDEYAVSAAAQELPFEPQWIIDALGLLELTSADQVEGPFPIEGGRLQLRSQVASPRGPMTRTVEIDARNGSILRQALYDSQNELVGWANAFNYEYDDENQVRLPRAVDVYFIDPQQNKVKMAFTFDAWRINNFYGDPDSVWALPNPADVQRVDLSRMGANGQSQPNIDAIQLPASGNTGQTLSSRPECPRRECRRRGR